MPARVETYRTTDQTKFYRSDWTGLLTISDSGTVGVSGDHKQLFHRLNYTVTGTSYWIIKNPDSNAWLQIWRALFDGTDNKGRR
jgi:hypothetical protein